MLVWWQTTAVPASAQTRTLAQVGSIKAAAQRVAVDGQTLYIAADRTLSSFDISRPATPRPVATYTFAERISAFVVSGGLVHALTEFFGLRVLDVSSPSSPTLRGALPLKGGVIGAVLLDPKTVLTVNMVAGVQVLDVSDPATPALLTSHFTDGYTQDVLASQPFAYVTDDPTGLYVLDLSKPRAPAQVSVTELDIPPPPGGIGLVDFPQLRLALIDRPGAQPARLAAVLDRTGGLLLVYDLTNPRAPAGLSRVKVPARAETLKAHGSRVYIAASDGVHFVDLGDPRAPVAAGQFKTEKPARDLAVSDTLVFVATGADGVVILRDATPGR